MVLAGQHSTSQSDCEGSSSNHPRSTKSQIAFAKPARRFLHEICSIVFMYLIKKTEPWVQYRHSGPDKGISPKRALVSQLSIRGLTSAVPAPRKCRLASKVLVIQLSPKANRPVASHAKGGLGCHGARGGKAFPRLFLVGSNALDDGGLALLGC